MKIALCQLNSTVGSFKKNLDSLTKVIEDLNHSSAEIFVFPELFLMGYPPRDLLDHQWFLDQSSLAIENLCNLSKTVPEKLIIVGTAIPAYEESGYHRYNSAIAISNGKVIHQQNKTLLPSYDVFDEHRYFDESRERSPFLFKGVSIGVTICEDMWNTTPIENSKRYRINPVHELVQQGAELLINISASPFHKRKQEAREKLVQHHAKTESVPFIMVNSVGANDELIFDGGSLFVNSDGETCCRLPYFQEEVHIVDTEMSDNKFIAENFSPMGATYRALTLGIRDYFKKTGFTSATIGLSGGIDSAVTAVLAVEALGKENVHGITMPSKYSSSGSVDDSVVLAKNLGINCDTLPIRDICDAFEKTLEPIFAGTPSGLAEENVQARSRGVLLMAAANKYGRLLLTTGNKSEMAVGYCTLYGDMNGAIAVLGDLYKTEVYELANYINRSEEIIPREIIEKAPSAELRPDQKDQDSLPPYETLDAILKGLLEEDRDSADLSAENFDESTVKWVANAIRINEHKRRQSAPVLKITPKAFGMGRRFPLAADYEW